MQKLFEIPYPMALPPVERLAKAFFLIISSLPGIPQIN
ncbi:hypothetical protein BLGI_636 [Brevibacillus laterosporus GI-9]|nr:hypothetical protein BLGI_636 [Brevibacillus laterosporus GI-9]